MQKAVLRQSQTQKLSPQQIQLVKLLQISAIDLEKRIEEELADNPFLEVESEQDFQSSSSDGDFESFSADSAEFEGGDSENALLDDRVDLNGDRNEDFDSDSQWEADEMSLSDYLNDTEISGYKVQSDGNFREDEGRESPLSASDSLQDSLMEQLGFIPGLTEEQIAVGMQIIGSLDSDGYLRRDPQSIVNDLAFGQNLYTTKDEVDKILGYIQKFDPPGIASRDLQECLLAQLYKKESREVEVGLAIDILEECYDDFIKKHHEKIRHKLESIYHAPLDNDEFKRALNLISKLNPKPGGSEDGDTGSQVVFPDFYVREENGELFLTLNSMNYPSLKLNPVYFEEYQSLDQRKKQIERAKKQGKNARQEVIERLKQTLSFSKTKIDSAQWFIDALEQRQQTLYKTMTAIMEFQKAFFLTGDESDLKPMVLRDIAQIIEMDISTVSRVANSKHVETPFNGILPLKYFFSEGIKTADGEEEVSNREVKKVIREIIEVEDKSDPLSDERIEQILKEKGYPVARRTVAKYRIALNIPVARLRREVE